MITMQDLAARLIEEGLHPGPFHAAYMTIRMRRWRGGRLPAPDQMIGASPVWYAETIDAAWEDINRDGRRNGSRPGD